MSAEKRLGKELERAKKSPTEGIIIDTEKSTLFSWRAVIVGPPGTPYEDGDFAVRMDFPKEYPFKAPKVKFETKVFHPNVYRSGDICLDILQDQWLSTYTGEKTLLSIQSLFTDPNPSSSANGEAGALFEQSKKKYEAKVREHVAKHAKPLRQRRMKAEAEAAAAAKEKEKEKEEKEAKEEAEAKAADKRKASDAAAEVPEAKRAKPSPQDEMVAQLVAEGLKNEALLRSLLEVVGDNKDLLRTLYRDHPEQ